jgi:hypothetical protein
MAPVEIPLCALELMDSDGNYSISLAEWETAAPNIQSDAAGFFSKLNATYIFSLCDMDQDGELSVADWVNATSPCKLTSMQVHVACFICNVNLPYQAPYSP